MSELQTDQGATRSRTVTWKDPTSVASRRTIYVIGEVRDGKDNLVAHAVGNFSIIDISAD